jgi:hypothetical protein
MCPTERLAPAQFSFVSRVAKIFSLSLRSNTDLIQSITSVYFTSSQETAKQRKIARHFGKSLTKEEFPPTVVATFSPIFCKSTDPSTNNMPSATGIPRVGISPACDDLRDT